MGLIPEGAREEELARMMARYGSDLLRLCYVALRDASLAEDAVQDTFLKAYRAMDSIRSESSEKAWLASIAMNTCRDLRRTAWMRRVNRSLTPEDLPEATAEAEDPDQTVLEAVMRLPPKHKEAVLLRYYEGMKLREIADALHISEETVKARLRRANDKLRKALKGWYYDE